MSEDKPPAAYSFRDVDASVDPEEHIRYLDGVRENEEVQERSNATRALLNLRAGSVALDAGCGAGDEVFAMANIVGPSGRVVGIDASEVMVAEATRRAEALGLNAEFQVGDLCALQFPDDTFDASHTERVLIHVESPVAAIRELVRVTRPGGRIAACETDFGASATDAPDRDVRKKITAWMEDKGVRNAWMGRQLRRLFLEEGLTDVSVAIRPTLRVPPLQEFMHTQVVDFANTAARDGYLTSVEAEGYLRWFEEAIADGTYLMMGIFFIVAGTVPNKR